jgi:hypothetical protein
MPEVLYTSVHEASGRYGLLVQLVCEKHLNVTVKIQHVR